MKYLSLFLVLIVLPLQAQKTLSGYVKEAGSGEAIIGALVEDSLLHLLLLPDSYDEVVITDSKPFEAQSRVELSTEQLEKIPALGGERDILKAITLFPGISNTNEGSAQILVRGGGNDQNLIMLDGTPVYNASHLAGFVSVFNSDAVKKIELYKGGFPASYGGRLSSILNLTMKEGNAQKWTGNFGIGIISSRFLLEGPIKKDKASFMLSARGAYLGLFTLMRQPAFNSGKVSDNFTYNFFDINGKLNYILSPKHHVFASFYTGRDISAVFERYGNGGGGEQNITTGRTTFDWGNTTATLRHNWLISNKLFAKAQLSYTQYRYQFIGQSKYFESTDSLFVTSRFSTNAKITDWIAKWQLEYSPAKGHSFKAGFDGFYHNYKPYLNRRTITDTIVRSDTVGKPYQRYVPEGALFVEGLYQHRYFELHYGFRWSFAMAEDTFYQIPEPRVALLVKINKQWALRAAFTQMGQYIHLLANNGVGFPNDIWVPVTKRVAPQKSIQYSAGAIWQHKNGIRVELEGFYKTMTRLIDYQFIGGTILGIDSEWEDVIATNGTGRAYGLELLIQKQIGKITGQLAYTLSKSERSFPSIQNNKPYPFKYDRRHQFSSFINWEINKHWDISAVWVYNTGHAVTLPVARIQGASSIESILIYGDRNNARMPDYHRLDLSVHYKKVGKKGRLNTWSLDIFNAYNRQNPFALFFRKNTVMENGQLVDKGYQVYQLSLFPILPSVSYALKF